MYPLKPSPDEICVEAEGVVKNLGGCRVLDGIDLQVRAGEILVILGGSGCGKATLLKHFIGVHSPDEGRVRLFGKNLASADGKSLDAIRRRFGVVFQSGALFSSLTVGENLALPLREHAGIRGDLLRTLVKMKLELVGLRGTEHLLPSELSGGMRKRVAIARAIALDPELVFFDEPGAGLDPMTASVMDQLILDLTRKFGITSILVTHEMASAFRVADRMVMLRHGKVMAHGTAEEIREHTDPYVASFIRGEPEGIESIWATEKDYAADLLE